MKIRLWFPILMSLIVLGLLAVKIFYVGSEPLLIGNVGDYKVVSCETKHSVGSLFSRDARGGFYRVYDAEGGKVFELFSDSFGFDVVTTGSQSAKFQLDSGDTHWWGLP